MEAVLLDGKEMESGSSLSLMMAHYLRHNYQATANRALSTSFPFPFLSFPSLACPDCSLSFTFSILTSHVLSL